MWTIAMPVTVVNDDEGNPAWFHPPCGVGHPFVDGKAVCPAYAQVDQILADALTVGPQDQDREGK